MFEETNYISCDCSLSKSDIVILGLPFDGTVSFRPGTRFGPLAIRRASIGLETYSPYLEMDLVDKNIHDAGDLVIPFGNTKMALNIIAETVGDFLEKGKRILSLGGEHLVTFPIIKEYAKHFDNLVIIHLDAHTDLREDYLGIKLSHACVIKRILEYIPAKNVYQFGIRSGEKNEFDFGKKNTNFYPFNLDSFKNVIENINEDLPIYLTVDIDVLDPSVMPGTGTPEPGGISFLDLITNLHFLCGKNIVGADVVELSPDYDPSKVSEITASKIVREILLIL